MELNKKGNSRITDNSDMTEIEKLVSEILCIICNN